MIVGTPDECLRKLARYDEIGVDQVLCYLNFGYLPHSAVMKSIELLGTHVIPELRKMGKTGVANSLSQGIRQAETSITEKNWARTPEAPVGG